jgi:multidrug resistance protein
MNRSILVLFITMFLVMLGFGILIPVLPFYVRHFNGNAATLGFLMASYSVMQLFFAPLWGRLSDRIGRRPVLLIGLSGYGVTFILYGLATHLWMLFAARIMAGVISSATLPTAMAYIADVTTPEDRAKGMGIMGAAIGLGIISGPAVGGFVGQYGLSLPFFVAGAVALLNLPFAFAYLPETLKPGSEGSSTARPGLSLDLLHHPQLPLFLLALTISFTMAMFESTFALFSADRVGLTARDMGVMFAVLGLLGVGLQGGGLGRLARRFGEVGMVTTAMLVSAVGFLCMVRAHSIPALWVTTALFSLGSSMMRPLISTLVTRSSLEGKGAVVGLQQSFDSLGRILGPVVGGTVYELSSSYPYLLGAVVLLGVLALIRPRLERFRTLEPAVARAGADAAGVESSP